jgi:hypothetical protein
MPQQHSFPWRIAGQKITPWSRPRRHFQFSKDDKLYKDILLVLALEMSSYRAITTYNMILKGESNSNLRSVNFPRDSYNLGPLWEVGSWDHIEVVHHSENHTIAQHFDEHASLPSHYLLTQHNRDNYASK